MSNLSRYPLNLLLAITGSFLSATANAAPVTFNTALPVAEDQLVWREQLLVRARTDETRVPGRRVDATAIASVLGYGINSRLAVFGVLPYFFDKELKATTPMGGVSRDADGFGDLSMFARYTAYQLDRPGQTLRIAPFAGFVAPTGDDDDRDQFGRLPRPLQAGTGSWGGFGGVVATYQTLDYQLDGQIAYRGHGSDEGFQPGDELRLDLSLQYRLLPRELGPGVPGFLYGVLESNFVDTDEDEFNSRADANSGGTQWFLTPGLQYVTRSWIVEAAVQLPVVQNMNGTALRDDYILHAGFRMNF